MKARIKQVTFEADVHQNDSRFKVPEEVARLLGLGNKRKIGVVIRSQSGRPLYGGIQELRSGREIYGDEMRKCIRRGKRIVVEVSNPN